MNKIYIKQFGPVQEADIDIDKKMQVFIGTQASGKSTVCKVIYFCQKLEIKNKFGSKYRYGKEYIKKEN